MIYSACDKPLTRFGLFRPLHGGTKQGQVGPALMASYNVDVQ